MIETERLRLVPIGLAHVDHLLALSNDPEVTRFVAPIYGLEAAREWLTAAEREWHERGHGLMAVLRREDSRFLGRAGLKYWAEFDETELGWVFRRDAWGHGYATEAGRACMAWGFDHLPVSYLTAMIQPPNRASVQVARRLGMSVLRRTKLKRFGVEVDVYAIDRAAATKARAVVDAGDGAGVDSRR